MYLYTHTYFKCSSLAHTLRTFSADTIDALRCRCLAHALSRICLLNGNGGSYVVGAAKGASMNYIH